MLLWVLALLFCSCTHNEGEKVEKVEVENYIPQPGMSVTDNELVWTNSNTLPSPFANSDGSLISTPEQWEVRRDHIQKMLEEYVYGSRPTLKINKVEISAEYPDAAVSVNAISYHAKIFYDNSRYFNIRVTRPRDEGNYPVIIRYEDNENFRFPIEKKGIDDKRYVIVALNHLSVAPDNGVVTNKQMHETKVLMAWAYAASLTVDYLETLQFTDCSRIAITGMSRTGKSAICAGVYDKRFSVVVPNNSGAAGASGFRNFGEKNTQAINIVQHQPTWVSEKLAQYRKNANELPLDMHFARALIAPRSILSTEAADGGDAVWAGPISTFKMWKASDYAFELYGKTNNNLIHLRQGKHGQLNEDYERMMQVINHTFYADSFDSSPYRKDIDYYDFFD